jgi:hypothetical protein
MTDLYGGSRVSKFFGFLSGFFKFLVVVQLIWSIAALVSLQWYVALGAFALSLCAFALSLVTAYVGYRMAGDRNNPGLATTKWENQRHINVVSDPVASWKAKIEALFEICEQDSGGDYSAAVAQLNLRNIPEPVQVAYERALRNPSRDSWTELKRALLENPPRHAS